MMADSQAVKNTCNAGVESKGFCRYKATNGIKRHVVVDTLGFPFPYHNSPDIFLSKRCNPRFFVGQVTVGES